MHNPTYRIVYTGIFAVLLAICSWISFPTLILFTLQTFGFFFTSFPLSFLIYANYSLPVP